MEQQKQLRMNKFLLLVSTILPLIVFGQNYTSYFTGNLSDVLTNPSGGVCLMGGASEDDNAMKWFLQRANGGDVLVLRATGSNGYNSYLYTGLGITVNSVETIVCNNASASNDPYVLQKIQQAEAIWFAGGNQWTYISYWRNSPFNIAINQAIEQRNIVIGGTSAGMAIQGKYYFSAQNGTITSPAALANPYNNLLTVDSAAFIQNDYLNNIITDTHFDDPDRKGRIVTFLARINSDFGEYAKAIACDEYTAVCIDTNGIARVFGDHPNSDDNAYFIQSNCELIVQAPENCTFGNPLTWDLGGAAIKAYQIKGNSTGSKTFDLTNWENGTGGLWYNWSVLDGAFSEQMSTSLNCSALSVINLSNELELQVYPNPVTNELLITSTNVNCMENDISFFNHLGNQIDVITTIRNNVIFADFSLLSNGLYFLRTKEKGGGVQYKILKN